MRREPEIDAQDADTILVPGRGEHGVDGPFMVISL